MGRLLPTQWRVRLVSGRRDVRLCRFREVLLAARDAPGYRAALDAAGLTSARSVTRLRSIENALSMLPCQSEEQYRATPEAFDNPSAPPLSLESLRLPIPGSISAAVLASNFRETDSVRVFDPESLLEIRRFDPGLIAAPLDVLLRWTGVQAFQMAVPSAHRALVAFTGIEKGALPECVREVLWETFEVPVFEQWVGSDGSVLAWECEAHEGMHVVEDRLVVEQNSDRALILTSLTDRRRPMLRQTVGVTASLVNGPCGCGQPGLRLCNVSNAVVERSVGAVA